MFISLPDYSENSLRSIARGGSPDPAHADLTIRFERRSIFVLGGEPRIMVSIPKMKHGSLGFTDFVSPLGQSAHPSDLFRK
jgi:hypothetical protein